MSNKEEMQESALSARISGCHGTLMLSSVQSAVLAGGAGGRRGPVLIPSLPSEVSFLQAFSIDIIRHKDSMDELFSQRNEIFGTCGEEQKAVLQVSPAGVRCCGRWAGQAGASAPLLHSLKVLKVTPSSAFPPVTLRGDLFMFITLCYCFVCLERGLLSSGHSVRPAAPAPSAAIAASPSRSF